MNKKRSAQVLKLVWCSPHPTHYNSYLFDQLSRIKSITFEAVYFYKSLAKYPWKSDFKGKYSVSYLHKFLNIDWGFILRKVKAKEELLVLAGWNEPTMLIIMIFFSIIGRPFILYSDTPELHVRYGLKRALRKIILIFIFKRAYRFLVTGKLGMRHAELIGVPIEKIVNFPFATNIDFFIPSQEKKERSKQIRLISSGRLDNAHKAYDLAIEALALLKEKHPEYKFHYRIAGTGPDERNLRMLIQEKNLTDEVLLIGWLEPIDLIGFYHEGDVFLHPSNFDPFPNAVLEAMSCGLPIIGSDAAGSVVDRIIEGENGYIHASKNVNDLYQKMVLMCQQTSEQRVLMGIKSREVAEQWSVSYHVGTIELLVQEYSTKA